MNAAEQEAEFAHGPAMAREPWWSRRRAARRPARLGPDAYSRAVALLKRLLPAIGIALLLLVAAWPRLAPLLESVRLSVSWIDLREARELKMINPRYTGTDRLNRPYVVTAAIGRQLPGRNDLMSLDLPRAVMIVHGGAPVVLTAASAIYQVQSQLLDLFDDVTLTHQNGTRFVTQRAHADVANSTAEGYLPVEGHGPSGDIWGQGFRVRDRGDTIVFTGRSRAILRGTKATKPAPAPADLPAEVLEAAAMVEAAASTAEDRQPGPLIGTPGAAAAMPAAPTIPGDPAPRNALSDP